MSWRSSSCYGQSELSKFQNARFIKTLQKPRGWKAGRVPGFVGLHPMVQEKELNDQMPPPTSPSQCTYCVTGVSDLASSRLCAGKMPGSGPCHCPGGLWDIHLLLPVRLNYWRGTVGTCGHEAQKYVGFCEDKHVGY